MVPLSQGHTPARSGEGQEPRACGTESSVPQLLFWVRGCLLATVPSSISGAQVSWVGAAQFLEWEVEPCWNKVRDTMQIPMQMSGSESVLSGCWVEREARLRLGFQNQPH